VNRPGSDASSDETFSPGQHSWSNRTADVKVGPTSIFRTAQQKPRSIPLVRAISSQNSGRCMPLHHQNRQRVPRIWVCDFPPYRATQGYARSNAKTVQSHWATHFYERKKKERLGEPGKPFRQRRKLRSPVSASQPRRREQVVEAVRLPVGVGSGQPYPSAIQLLRACTAAAKSSRRVTSRSGTSGTGRSVTACV
jgi:hypothetical protein